MLECSALLIRPAGPEEAPLLAQRAKRDAVRIREIVDLHSWRVVGVAYRVNARSRWRRWGQGPVIEVHESDDEPLLFTIHRLGWFSEAAEVRDADGRAIGLVRGLTRAGAGPDRLPAGLVIDSSGCTIALFFRRSGSRCEEGGFMSTDGVELAGAGHRPEGITLTFAESIGTQPFLRMLLLAALVGRP